MSKVAKAVRGFLKSMGWRWHEMAPTRYEVIVPGQASQWLWLAQWEEDDSFLAGHSIVPVSVPAKRRPAAAEYLTRANYNMRVGNFEMDYADGQVCFRTSMFLCGLRPTVELIKRMAFANFSAMDQYLPSLLAVTYGKATPKAAIRQAEQPREVKAGRTMLLAVAGFGAATIVFGLSKNLWLSMAMLALTGALDNISVVVRHTMVQLATPNEMRGRISAVNSMFISSSNELGGFESGTVAHFFGPVVSVVSGGIGTIAIVLAWAGLFPKLRKVGRLGEH